MPYSGFAMASRAFVMHVILRIFRVVAFLSVVLPNARNPRCYAHRFKPVPEGWADYMWAGVTALKGAGGCNDLIFRCVCAPLSYGEGIYVLRKHTTAGARLSQSPYQPCW